MFAPILSLAALFEPSVSDVYIAKFRMPRAVAIAG